MNKVFIALGSNINPKYYIHTCLEHLAAIKTISIQKISSYYKTLPWGFEKQANFINLVIAIETTLSPSALLIETQYIEKKLNRIKTQVNGPRTIDIDILLYENQIINIDDLIIPHVGLLERDFMLIPLIEIAPDILYPGLNKPVGDLMHYVKYQQIIEKL